MCVPNSHNSQVQHTLFRYYTRTRRTITNYPVTRTVIHHDHTHSTQLNVSTFPLAHPHFNLQILSCPFTPLRVLFRSPSLNRTNSINFPLSPFNYLHFWWSSLVAYQQQMALILDEHLLLESATLRRLFLDVLARQVPVHQRRFARAQRAHDAQPQLWYCPGDRPFLTVYKGICKYREKKEGDHMSIQ